MRTWTCRKCGGSWPRRYAKCQDIDCTGRRPAARVPRHRRVLDELPYEWWVSEFGERCGICTREPSATRRLDRDHDHKTGEPRGLLCHRCNRALPDWVTAVWLEKARAYVEGAA